MNFHSAKFCKEKRCKKGLSSYMFFRLSFYTMILWILLGLTGLLQKRGMVPVYAMKNFPASISPAFFRSFLPFDAKQHQTHGFSEKHKFQVVHFLFRILTNLRSDEPSTLLTDTARMSVPDKASSFIQHKEKVLAKKNFSSSQHQSSPFPTSPPKGTDIPAPTQSQSEQTNELQTAQKKVFIYHSHNQESWFPELKPGSLSANSNKINITLVGKRLVEQLGQYGIGANHSAKDYASAVEGYRFNKSFKYSSQTIQEAISQNAELQFFFDIHRDSQKRNVTTAKIGSKNYAKSFFIIGHGNPNWQKNDAFANELHKKLEKYYPGLSRGVWGKSSKNGNGEYNQSISTHSVLIEVGGVENTLEECYRTADALAKIISEIVWEKQETSKVDAESKE